MDDYTLMRLSSLEDEDAVDYDEISPQEALTDASSASSFKSKYKEFYSDIKTDINEDW